MAPDDLSPRETGAAAEAAAGSAPAQGPRQTLAMRLAERNRQRELRAERLARLRPPASEAPSPASIEADGAALEDFLRALTADLPPLPEGPPVEPGELVPFQRPEPSPAPAPLPAAGDLDRLPGIGPGLIWALERAGLHRLADLAPLAPSDLAARLGPLGRLVPVESWITVARAG
jgi:hypothetical protein